ncbi:flagellar basal body rod protein FlgC [Acidisoma sp. C75]
MAQIFSIVGSALFAQDQRLNAIASNLANADSIAAPGTTPYRAQEVVFEAAPVTSGAAADSGMIGSDATGSGADSSALGVRYLGTVQSNAPISRTYDPGSPYADANGYVSGSNVSRVGQMVDLINTSSSYAASVAVLQESMHVDQQMLSGFQVT